MLTNFFTNYTRDNLDKSVEFIFDNNEEKIETKILRNEELCESENHKLTAKTSFITKRFNLEYKQRYYKSYLLKFVCYFTVFCELSRRVGGGIFWVDKIF